MLGKSRIYSYAASGTLLGVVLGVAITSGPSLPVWRAGAADRAHSEAVPAQPATHPPSSAGSGTVVTPEQPRDLGGAQALASGLDGQLTTKWNNGLDYRLTIEPTSQSLRPGFALAVTSSPRPLSVGIELLDSAGTALCGRDIVVRFDPTLGKSGGGDGNAVELLKQQELAREHGRDIFENQIGDDGQIAAIGAQGRMPCTQQAYSAAASWTLSADFPSVSEQGELLKSETVVATSLKTPVRTHRKHKD
jgi:hypothetical protein